MDGGVIAVLYGYQVVRPRAPEYVESLAFSAALPVATTRHAPVCEYCATPHTSACCPNCGGPAPGTF